MGFDVKIIIDNKVVTLLEDLVDYSKEVEINKNSDIIIHALLDIDVKGT